MKILLQTKTWIILILSGFVVVAVAVISSCTPSPGIQTPTTSGSTGSKPSTTDTRTLKCELPKCSGSKCCDKKDKDCDNICEDSDYLSLGGDAYNKCIALSESTVDRLGELFKDILERPRDAGKLEDLEEEDIDLICGAVKELDKDVLEDRIDHYSSRNAKLFLEWMANEKTVMEIFENTEDTDDGIKMVKTLLETAGNSSGDVGVLKGLWVDVNHESGSDEDEHVLYLALKNNERLVAFIHDEIISDDNGLCSSDNLPTPVVADGAYSSADGKDKNYYSDYEEDACILGVYCKIQQNRPQDDFMEEIAKFLENENVSGFIEASTADGGLNGDEAGFSLTDNDWDDWTPKACENLKHFWNNGELDLDL